MYRRTMATAALASVIALVIVACGGGKATPATAPTKAAPTASPLQATPTPGPRATPSGPQPKYGGVLQARLTRDWENWDTYNPAGPFTTVFNQQLLSNLVRFKKDSISRIEPDTAQSWDAAADGRTYTFTLRKEVTWSDGKPFTSADVRYNLERAATDPKANANKERVALVDAIETPDPFSVKVNLKRPSASFLANIAGPFMLMYPAQMPDLAAWQKAPVGSGPFVFKEYNKGSSYVFRKNPNHYGKDDGGRPLPYLDGIDYIIIADPAFALASFRSGRLQCGCGYDSDFLTENKEQLERDIPGVKIGLTFPSRHEIRFNVKKTPFSNLAFRQAVAIGFDKDKVASVYRRGKNYWPAPPLIAPEQGGQWGLPKGDLIKMPGYNPEHSMDLALARQKFQESSIDPRTVQVEVMFSTFFGPEGELMATVLGELGLKVTSTPLQTGEMTQRRINGNFDLDHVTAGLSLDDPADQYSSELLSDGSFNFGKYANPRMDQLLRDQESELDPVKRRALLWEVQRINLSEFPMVPFLYQGNGYGTRPEVFNYHTPPLAAHAAFRLDDVWLG